MSASREKIPTLRRLIAAVVPMRALCYLACLSHLALAGCSSTQAQVQDLASLSAQPAAASAAPPPVQTLSNGEKVRVTVFGEPQLSGEFEIDGSGNLAMPLIGQVPAAGRTARDVEASVTKSLKGRYLVDPKVNVEVATHRPIYLIGEVKTAGEYPYKPGLNVVSAIALAGGYTPRASPSYIYIKRANATTEEEVASAPNIPVYPGDLIRVPERYF